MGTPIQLDPKLEHRLAVLAARSGRTKRDCLQQIIEKGIEELEDYYLATEVLERVNKGEEKIHALQDVRKEFGLED